MIDCEYGDCKAESAYCVSIEDSDSHSNLLNICKDHIGLAVRLIADEGQYASVYRPDAIDGDNPDEAALDAVISALKEAHRE